jgi:hypothetical protein
VQEIVAREDESAVDVSVGVRCRRRADRDDDPIRRQVVMRVILVLNANAPRVHERRGAAEDVDVVASQLMARDIDFVADDLIDAEEQIAHRHPLGGITAAGRRLRQHRHDPEQVAAGGGAPAHRLSRSQRVRRVLDLSTTATRLSSLAA